MFHPTALTSVYTFTAMLILLLFTCSGENTFWQENQTLMHHIYPKLPFCHPQVGRVTCPQFPQHQTSTQCCPATRTPWMGPIPSILSTAPARTTWQTLRRATSVQLLFSWLMLRYRLHFLCCLLNHHAFCLNLQ